MTIRFQFRRYRLALKVAVRTAREAITAREGVIVRLEAEGKSGFGEAAPLGGFGQGTAAEIAAECGRWNEMPDRRTVDGLPSRFGCLRNAVAAAQMEITPAPASRSISPDETATASLLVTALLPAGRAAVSAAKAKAEAGFRTFKWKVGAGDAADELALLDELCAVLPGGAKLRLDANGAWDRRRTEQWLDRCAERPVEFIEQPCPAAAAPGSEERRLQDLMLGLSADYPTPIALDESVANDADIDRWLAAGWKGIFVIKPALHADAGAVLGQLQAAKADVVFSSALETAVGARAALRHAFRWAGERRAVGFGVWPLFADARFDGPAAAPLLRREEVERIDMEAVWNALD